MVDPKRRRLLFVLLFVAGAIAIGSYALFSQSLLRSEAGIRKSLFKETHIGTSEADVRAVVSGHGWLVADYAGTTGFVKKVPGKANEVMGVTSIKGNLGRDSLGRNVTAFWGFDREGQLIDIWVWKTNDAP